MDLILVGVSAPNDARGSDVIAQANERDGSSARLGSSG
jgi:hypothetical protein